MRFLVDCGTLFVYDSGPGITVARLGAPNGTQHMFEDATHTDADGEYKLDLAGAHIVIKPIK
jgi:hypothetical protein